MSTNSAQWKRIERLLDEVLDLQEASEGAREAKVARLLEPTSARLGGLTPSGAGATPPLKPRRGWQTR